MTVELVPVDGVPEIRPGDDLAGILAERVHPLGARDGDVIVVTQKVVSKAEGRIVPEAEREAAIAAGAAASTSK